MKFFIISTLETPAAFVSYSIMVLSYFTVMMLDTHTERGPLLTYGLIIDVVTGFLAWCIIQSYFCHGYYKLARFAWFFLDLSVVYSVVLLFTYYVFAAPLDDNYGSYVACCVISIPAILSKFVVTRTTNDLHIQLYYFPIEEGCHTVFLNNMFAKPIRQADDIPTQNQSKVIFRSPLHYHKWLMAGAPSLEEMKQSEVAGLLTEIKVV